jgi:hypothetical protein
MGMMMDILRELKLCGCEMEPSTGGIVLIRCPLPGHEDQHPSCQVRIEETEKYKEGSWYCPVCQKGGDVWGLLAMVSKVPAAVYKKKHTRRSKVVATKKVEEFYANLNVSGHKTSRSENAKRCLRQRGLTDATINSFSLGFDPEGGRIAIPIPWGKKFVDILKYKPGAQKNKFYHYSVGYGSFPLLYPETQLRFDKIVLCGGPLKALVVAQEMNKHGFGGISFNGEKCIPLELVPWFYGKKVWVCFDVDNQGVKAANQTCGVLKNKIDDVRNVLLPLSPEVYPKGDVNDYFGEDEDFTDEDFLKLLEETPVWEDPTFIENFDEPFKDVPIQKLWGYSRPFNFRTTAYISGIDDTTAYKVPKELKVSCTADAEVCSLCRLARSDGYDPHNGVFKQLDQKDPACLTLVNVNKKQRYMALKDYFGVPETCCKVVFEPSDELNTIRHILLSDTETDSENPMTAYVITSGEDLYSGEICTIEGRADQSPNTHEEVRIICNHVPKDILTDYVVSKPELLKIFQPEENTYESLCEKVDDINWDLERNVTFIYNRPAVHSLFDLTFHSPLYIPYENAIEPGWVSCLLVSETAQGKSTIMRRLIQHYGFGSYIDAANTSVAGLVGGIKSVGRRQFVKWGILPQMDKRFVCIEEYANAPVELLRSMRTTRDSGYVVLNKIDKGRAKARCRTVIMSNPKTVLKHGVVVDGIHLLEELVERPEDLRRFDVGMWIPTLKVEDYHDADDPKYSAEACHELITWAWTIPTKKIKFTSEADNAIRRSELSAKFPYLHLVGGREFGPKLARLSAAIAARTYSIDGDELVIEERHVKWVENFLVKLYSDPEFGYINRVQREDNMDKSISIDSLLSILKLSNNPPVLCQFLEIYNRYPETDLRAACGDGEFYSNVKNRLIILGCIVGEDDTKWNNVFLPTKRLKKLLPEAKKSLQAQYKIPSHIEKLNEGSSSI